MAPGEITGYRLTPKAEDDLAAIWRLSAETWSAAQADTYLDTLVATIETIVAMPTLARERPEFDPPVRIHPTAEHVIIYLIDGDIVVVIRILGGRQNWRAILETIDA
jgi:toxin ParE1/3/4